MSKPILYGITYSPWSLRARWALYLNGVEYDYKEYVILLTMPALRLKLKKFFGRVTIPVLIDGKDVYGDSRDIVRYADKKGGRNLDREKDAEFESILRDAEEIAESGRMITTRVVMKDADLMIDSLPSFLPKNTLGMPVAYTACWYLGRKYAFDDDVDAGRERMRESALRLQSRLGDNPFFFDELSYADIVVATCLQMIKPVDKYVRVGAKSAWTRDFADEVSDLLAWRDAFFDAHHWRSKLK